jgi:hypothetical protein
VYQRKKSKVLVEMGTANRDASQITVRNRNKALASYYSSWESATMKTGGTNVIMSLKAPAVNSAELIAQENSGCVACLIEKNNMTGATPDPNQPLYPTNGSRGGASSTTSTS